jgi:hypothetical protein
MASPRDGQPSVITLGVVGKSNTKFLRDLGCRSEVPKCRFARKLTGMFGFLHDRTACRGLDIRVGKRHYHCDELTSLGDHRRTAIIVDLLQDLRRLLMELPHRIDAVPRTLRTRPHSAPSVSGGTLRTYATSM